MHCLAISAPITMTLLSPARRVRTLTLVEPGAYWILEQLGMADPDVERMESTPQRLLRR